MTPAEKFVRQMAALTTPTDPEKIEEWLQENDFDPDGYDTVEEEVIADLPGDDAYDEALTFFRMIREARDIVAELDKDTST